MATRAELKATLDLNNGAFIRGAKQAENVGKALGRTLARINMNALAASAAAVRVSIQGTAASIAALAAGARTSFGIAAAGAAAATALMAGLSKASVGAAGKYETLSASFEVFLGSADAAKQRMKELAKFAQETPFELTEVASASRVLQSLTKGALATSKGLTLVGDAAASAGNSTNFEELAVTIGRVYNGLQSGSATIGYETGRLVELGLMAMETKEKLEAMQKAGEKGAGLWKLAETDLMRSAGMMARQAKTWEGKMSAFKDSVQGALRKVGEPLITGLKPALELLTKSTDGMASNAERFGKALASGTKEAVDLLVGVFQDPSRTIEPFKQGMIGAMKTAANYLIAGIKLAVRFISDGDAVKNLAVMFQGLSETVGGYFMQAFQRPAAYLMASIDAAMAKLPTSMGGSGEEEQASGEFAQLSATRTALEAKAEKLRASGDMEGAAKYDPSLKELRRQQSIALKKSSGQFTLEDRVNEKMANGGMGASAKGMISNGKATMSAAAAQVARDASNLSNGFSVPDVLGASGNFAAASKGVQSFAQAGARITAAVPKPAAPAGPDNAQANMEALFGLNRQGFTSTSSLNQSSLARGAKLTPEAKSLEDRQRLLRKLNGDTSDRSVRRGDAKALRELKKEAGEKGGLEKLLQGVTTELKALRTTFTTA